MAEIDLYRAIAGNTYNCRLIVAGGANNGISNEDDAVALA